VSEAEGRGVNLPALNSVTQCPKCGNVTEPENRAMEYHAGPRFARCDVKGEHLTRSCPVCRHRWPEACFVPEQPELPT
jgi:hypothetical protein